MALEANKPETCLRPGHRVVLSLSHWGHRGGRMQRAEGEVPCAHTAYGEPWKMEAHALTGASGRSAWRR